MFNFKLSKTVIIWVLFFVFLIVAGMAYYYSSHMISGYGMSKIYTRKVKYVPIELDQRSINEPTENYKRISSPPPPVPSRGLPPPPVPSRGLPPPPVPTSGGLIQDRYRF